MASPNHKAGLAVVVPASDNRSQTQAIVKQNALSSPRKPRVQKMNVSPFRQDHVGHSTHRQFNMPPSSHLPNGDTATYQSKEVLSARQPPNGAVMQANNHVENRKLSHMTPRPSPGVPKHQSRGTIAARPRLLGVDEALQYSPFSSIVPFNSDIIPTPNVDLSGLQNIFPTRQEQHMARQPLERLDAEMSASSGQSSLVSRVRNDLKLYLDPNIITDFKFKAVHGKHVDKDRARRHSSNPTKKAGPVLSLFANSVLQTTDLSHRYPTPTSPSQILPQIPSDYLKTSSETPFKARLSPQVSTSQPEKPNADLQYRKIQLQTPITPTTQDSTCNDGRHLHNAEIPSKSGSLPTSGNVLSTPMVIIPPPSAEAYRSDFITYEDAYSKNQAERSNRERGKAAYLGTSIPQARDQRAASDDFLQQLQDLIEDIFDAEDHSQLDRIESTNSKSLQLFVLASHEGQETLTLTSAVHVKLESLLQKVIHSGRFEDILVEHLQRLQHLSEGSLTSANSSDLHIDHHWDAEGFASWIVRLDTIDAGLRSARTIIRIMTGGRKEKELYSEDLLQTLLGLVKRLLDHIIIPVAEARSSGTTSTIFEGCSSHKKVLSQLLLDFNKVMALLTRLLAAVEMDEKAITSIEFFSIPLLFVENSPAEKDSVLGVQRFENLRRTALDQITVIFSRYQEQRTFLFNEILTSLQKLPINEKHARQYKLSEGKSIMLVSALIMQLVQISAKQSKTAKRVASRRKPTNLDKQERNVASDEDSSSSNTESERSNDSDKSEQNSGPHSNSSMQLLSEDASSLIDNATKSAQYITTFLVQRASNTAKSSESPHRHHLDMFVQDFITVLCIPEWPAAELLLRMVFASCRNIAETPKTPAPTKNMALELLGMMGSAISDLVSSTRHASRSLDTQDAEFSQYLRQTLEDFLNGSLESSELLVWDGPYHAIVEYLERSKEENPGSVNAQAYFLAQWAKGIASGDLKAGPKKEKLVSNLQKMLSGAAWTISDTLPSLTINQCRVAYALTVLNMGFCRQSDYILKILLDSITSEQVTVRTRSLKSVDKMLEGDPSVLDRAKNVMILITNCASDASPMVRESALTLIGKCITLRPLLEQEFLRFIMKFTDDPAIGIRKRSIKMLKEIYLRNHDAHLRTAIGDNLLQRIRDLESSVGDLARQTLEEIWLAPFWNIPDLVDASAQSKVDLRKQIRLIVGIVRRSEKVAAVLAQLLKATMSGNVKYSTANIKVCKSFVATAFEIMVDNFQDADRLEQRHILQTLTVFATAKPGIFTLDQLQILQPYISNVSGKDDREIFRSIVIIFRYVLPMQPTVQHKLLEDVQIPLLQSSTKVGRAELNEVAQCLWMIHCALGDPARLLRLIISVLEKLHKMQDKELAHADSVDDLKRTKKYIQIAGYFGKHCDFETYLERFQKSLTWNRASTVAELIVVSISPFTTSNQPLSLRAEAFDSVGLVCQSWPYQFTQEHVSNAFQDVLGKGEPELQTIVLSNFRDFFAKIDRQAEVKNGETAEGVNGSLEGKLGGSMTANEGDGASALIAQRFLKDILHIALASQDSSALTATEVIASINRQGLVHPKESGPALVALETSTNPAIADVAYQEHRVLHQQHESMFEREYMRAIQEAFKYQKQVVGDTLGYKVSPHTSKLAAMFEIIKTSKGKYQKKFLSNFCSKIDFDVAKMDISGSPPIMLQFSRFLTENLALFEYGRLDELLHTISCMEKIVADTGSGIAHSISTELFNITVEAMPDAGVPSASQDQIPAEAPKHVIDVSRLKPLTVAAIILSSLWETRTYLRRLYGQGASAQKKEGKAKMVAKDLNKAPSRVQGITSDKLFASIAAKNDALGDEDLMKQQCKEFVELLSIDNEVKVAYEEEDNAERLETPSADDEQDTPMSGRSQGMKRKSSASITETPLKKRKGRPSVKRRKSGKSVDSDEGWD